MFHFAFGVNIDKNQLMYSEKSNMQETVSKSESWFFLNDWIFIYKNTCDFFLWFPLAWSWISHKDLDLSWISWKKTNSQTCKKSGILAKNEKYSRSWQKIQDYAKTWQENQDSKHWVIPRIVQNKQRTTQDKSASPIMSNYSRGFVFIKTRGFWIKNWSDRVFS